MLVCSSVSTVSSVVARLFSMRIYGINPVLEGLRAGRVTAIRIAGRGDDRLTGLLRLAEDQHITITRVGPGELDRLTRGAVHQGIAANCAASAALPASTAAPYPSPQARSATRNASTLAAIHS